MGDGRTEVRLTMATADRLRLREMAGQLGIRPQKLLALVLLGQLETIEGRLDGPARTELEGIQRRMLGPGQEKP